MAQNGTTDVELSAKQKRALVALLSHPTVATAAADCNLGERTVKRYLADPTFKAELRARQDAVVSSVTASLVGLAGKSIEALLNILENEGATDAVKCRAALGWLAQMGRSIELADLVERIEDLEEALLVNQG